MNWKNLRDMWLNISSATYDTKIETSGRVEHIKHCSIHAFFYKKVVYKKVVLDGPEKHEN